MLLLGTAIQKPIQKQGMHVAHVLLENYDESSLLWHAAGWEWLKSHNIAIKIMATLCRTGGASSAGGTDDAVQSVKGHVIWTMLLSCT